MCKSLTAHSMLLPSFLSTIPPLPHMLFSVPCVDFVSTLASLCVYYVVYETNESDSMCVESAGVKCCACELNDDGRRHIVWEVVVVVASWLKYALWRGGNRSRRRRRNYMRTTAIRLWLADRIGSMRVAHTIQKQPTKQPSSPVSLSHTSHLLRYTARCSVFSG